MILKKIKAKIENTLEKIFQRPFLYLNAVLDSKKLNSLDRFSKDYFAQRNQGQWLKDTNQIVKVLYKEFKPKSVLDIGCATGVYLKLFKDLGAFTLRGYEGSQTAVNNSLVPDIMLADLREKINIQEKFDLILCVEVAPYISKTHENQLIENLIRACHDRSVIIFTASDKQKGGVYHINLKSKREWIDLFKEKGLIYCQESTEKISKQLELKTLFWVKENLMIFSKNKNC